MDLSNQQPMESKGWVVGVTNSISMGTYDDICGSETWYGWTPTETVGYIEIVLNGPGLATINYGNCFHTGAVNVYLNNELFSSANGNVKDKLVEFSFSNGASLKFTEDHGIIKLNSVEIKCGRYFFLLCKHNCNSCMIH